ncbi:regulator [Lactococcus hodotermopsidis]|uniref:Regulator n=1 Tax=Pseudolactococcus hodotermopsidis TaxID=2709157 RepID=A0A6A0BD92_9LACT|nr:hypothetical protein [Lactococcus hodotermopsidis]GFH42786.1 regulator [Lactococcus hodotermopsidis]
MLTIDEKILELDDLTDEVVRAFLTLDVVADFRTKAERFKSDRVLQADLQTLAENREFLPFRAEVRELQKSILMNETIYQLKVAENDVQKSLSDLAKKIAGAVSDDIFVDENLPFGKGGHHGRHARKFE